jgi:AraC family transcriptional regulator
MNQMITAQDVPKLMANELLVDSSQLDWENLTLKTYHTQPQDILFPMFCDYAILSYQGLEARLCRQTCGPWESNRVGTGWVSILTRAQVSHWRWDAPLTTAHVYLTYNALAAVAAEVFERDIEDIELHDIAATQDIVLAEMVARLSDEASMGGLGVASMWRLSATRYASISCAPTLRSPFGSTVRVAGFRQTRPGC